MTCTLDLYTDYLVSSTGPTTATGLSRLLDGALSHDHITRWLSSTVLGSPALWRQAKPLIRHAEGGQHVYAAGASSEYLMLRSRWGALAV